MSNTVPEIISITSVVPVTDVDACASFFEKIGFARTNEVSEDPTDPSTPLGFVIMANATSQIMFQSLVSIRNDDENLLPEQGATALIFLIVENLDSIITALADYPVFMNRRTTFYGSNEIGITGPDGHKFTFAHFANRAV